MKSVDLLVLGGGITGLGVARLAARSGWSVALIERHDLASGASSASSHMLHGGLRYLEHGHFALVREALAERGALLRMAPALATPIRFVAPVWRSGRVPLWKLRLGLALYDLLAGRAKLAPHAMANTGQALALEPDLRREGLAGGGLYSDVVMDDARLAIAVARDAAAHGAEIITRGELTELRPAGDGVDVAVRGRIDRAERRFHARALVNATGAWTDRTRRELVRALRPGTSDPPLLLRPTRGIHLVYPALTRGHGIVLTAGRDGRVFFVVPFAGRSLVGTTETEVESPPREHDYAPSSDEIRYLHAELARALPAARDARPLAAVAGLRPLATTEGGVHEASREHVVVEDGPVVTVAGGKYTTFRVMARDVLEAVAGRLGRAHPEEPEPAPPLPAPAAADAAPSVHAAHAAEHEYAQTLEDVMRRRTTLWLADDGGLATAAEVAEAMGRRLGWAPEREREERDRWEATVLDGRERLARALDGDVPRREAS